MGKRETGRGKGKKEEGGRTTVTVRNSCIVHKVFKVTFVGEPDKIKGTVKKRYSWRRWTGIEEEIICFQNFQSFIGRRELEKDR